MSFVPSGRALFFDDTKRAETSSEKADTASCAAEKAFVESPEASSAAIPGIYLRDGSENAAARVNI